MSAGVLYLNPQEMQISESLKLLGVYLILGQLLIRPDYAVVGFERLDISLWVGWGGERSTRLWVRREGGSNSYRLEKTFR